MLTENIKQKPEVINTINLVQDCIIHPEFNVPCKRHKIIERKPIKHASLDKPAFTQYINAQYKFKHPETGKIHYYTPPLPNVTGKKRHDNSTILKAIQPAITNQMTYSDLAKKGRTFLNLDTVPSTIYKWINQVDIDDNAFNELHEKIKEKSSGHFSIDEVYDDEGTIITTDPVADTIINISTHKDEITNDIVEKHLTDIKEMDLSVKSFTKDGSPLYINTIINIFGVMIHLQTCLFHLMKLCSKDFIKWMKSIRDQIQIPNMKRGRKKKGDKNKSNGNQYKKLKQTLFRLRYMILKFELSVEEREKLRDVFKDFSELKLVRYCFLRLKRLLNISDLGEAEYRYNKFISDPIMNIHLSGVINKLKLAYKRNELFSYLQFEKK